MAYYYNRDGIKLNIDFNGFTFVNDGACANVYRYEDIIFKQYYVRTMPFERINIFLFDYLKEIDNKHFMKLYDIYCKMNDNQFNAYKNNRLEFKIDAYTAKYYEPQKNRLLYETTDYFLNNLIELEGLFDELANNGIEVNDVKVENTIITSDGIVIIDPDLFYCDKDTTVSEKKYSNKVALLSLFKALLLNSIDYSDECDYQAIIKNVFNNFDFTFETDTKLSNVFARKLERSNRPIDYFLK